MYIYDTAIFLSGGQGDGFVENSSDSEGEEKEDGKRSTLRLDDWVIFRSDIEVRKHDTVTSCLVLYTSENAKMKLTVSKVRYRFSSLISITLIRENWKESE